MAKRFRDAITGFFMRKVDALSRKNTTVAETIRVTEKSRIPGKRRKLMTILYAGQFYQEKDENLPQEAKEKLGLVEKKKQSQKKAVKKEEVKTEDK